MRGTAVRWRQRRAGVNEGGGPRAERARECRGEEQPERVSPVVPDVIRGAGIDEYPPLCGGALRARWPPGFAMSGRGRATLMSRERPWKQFHK